MNAKDLMIVSCYLHSGIYKRLSPKVSVSGKQAKVYNPVGTCIYCGTDGGSEGLTDEHIVPFALLGNMILPKSSCRQCATVTSAFELICSRSTYGSFRMREKLPTRRPAKRPSEVSVEADGLPMMVAEAGAIAGFPIIRFKTPPGALTIPPVANDWPEVELEVKTAPPREPDHWDRLPRGNLTFAPVTFHIPSFARLCAKIAHGFAVAEFGIDGFEAWLPSYILGTDRRFGHVLGSSHEQQRSDPIANALNWSAYETAAWNLLAVHIHLFPSMGQPPITVVVGSMSISQYEGLRART